MNNILELIRNEEVKWVSLGEVFKNIVTGKLNANKREENGIYPFYTCDEKPYRINTYAFDCEALLVSGNGSKVGHINYYKGKFNAYQRTYVLYDLKENNDIKYIYYYLKFALKKYLNNNIFKGSIPFITMPILTEFKIPIPSLETQRKIVDILDRYTKSYEELKECLAKEKDLRIKQYEYYKDMLLSQEYLLKKAKELCGQDAVVQWKEITEITNKIKNIKWNVEDSTKEYIYIDLSSVNLENNNITNPQYITKINAPSRAKQIIKTNDIIFGTTRPLLKRIAFIDEKFDNQICSTGYCVIRTNTVKINPRYVYYCMQTTDFYLNVGNYQKGASYPAISDADLKQIQIPIPPLQVQTHISAILDKYTSSYLQLQSTLSKEIEFRTKQYEYYREKLLDFKK